MALQHHNTHFGSINILSLNDRIFCANVMVHPDGVLHRQSQLVLNQVSVVEMYKSTKGV